MINANSDKLLDYTVDALNPICHTELDLVSNQQI